MLHRTFNSLSRDHWQVHSDHHHIRNSFKLLSTPSLGITRNSEVARTRTVGLAFNSLSRDHASDELLIEPLEGATFNSLSRDHDFGFGELYLIADEIPPPFNSLSRDHKKVEDLSERYLRNLISFNSLSRDHFSEDQLPLQVDPPFNSLSRDHLEEYFGELVGWLDVSFNSLSRDHYIYRSSSALPSARSNFQLPLSGSRSRRESSRPSRVTSLSTPSLGITSSRIRKSPQLRSSSFQLPLSGSPSRLRARRSGCGMPRLSTPSLGITIEVSCPHCGYRWTYTFNSLSRDHFRTARKVTFL